jgi:tetraacyldisaccharide 4'-kinase
MSVSRGRIERAWADGLSPANARLAVPLCAAYRGALGTRDWLYARGILKVQRVDLPVVSVGNLTVGGTGKTPAVMLAVETLTALGHRPAVISRGYGRRTTGVRVVADTASIRLDADDAGDEPFLLARRLPGVPVVVGANRADAARLAIDRFGVTAVVLDDGFQQRTLAKDLDVVMARAERPWGNGRLLPAGPLREPLSALARAHLLVATGPTGLRGAPEVREAAERYAPGVPVLSARYVAAEAWDAARMVPIPLDRVPGARVLAFAGIGFPAGFRRTLVDLGVDVADVVTYHDHHPYALRDVAALGEHAARLGVDALVTTEKDWVRIRGIRLPPRPVWVVSVRLALVEGEAAWRAAFERVCRTA